LGCLCQQRHWLVDYVQRLHRLSEEGRVLGGGVQSNTGLTSVNINSTFPEVGGWRIFENNASGFNVNLTVYASCGT
jgi:hypothetical protein